MLNKYLFLDASDTVKYLRSVLRNEMNSAHNEIPFNATDAEITSIVGSGGTDLSQMLDRPMSVFPPCFK